MFTLRPSPATFIKTFESTEIRSAASVVVCAAKGPRPRYPRVWKTNKKFGTISKSTKLVECIKELSNVKEEVYGALDSFIAWELEFPLITVKKAMKILENEREWKRIIQVTKWMLSKGQGKTMGSYFALLTALAEDGRIDEAEELWTKLFSEHLESMPRIFFDKMVSIYYKNGMHEKLFEIFADMEELGVRPNVSIVKMVGDVFRKMDMMDKYIKLNKKYPPPKWEYRYIKGKRVKVLSKRLAEFDTRSKTNKANKDNGASEGFNDSAEEISHNTDLLCEEIGAEIDNRSNRYYAKKDDTASGGYDGYAEVTSHKTNLMFEEIETEFDNRSSTGYSNKDDTASKGLIVFDEDTNYNADLVFEDSEMSANELYDETNLPA